MATYLHWKRICSEGFENVAEQLHFASLGYDLALNQTRNLSLVGDWASNTENSSTQNRTCVPIHELVSVASQGVTHDAMGNKTLIPAVFRGSSQTLQHPLKMK